jgi:hypothetical protein
MEQIRSTIFEEVDEKINFKIKKERQRNSANAAKPTDVLHGEGADNLRKIISMKADKVDLEKLFEIKSNKIDVENLLDIQSIMGK